MKTIILYIRRNTGLLALFYFTRKFKEAEFKIVTDDESILYWCKRWNLEVTSIDKMGDYDWLFCVHGNRIISEDKLREGRCINWHPLLFKYKGHDPVKRFLKNGDTVGSVESHFMTGWVDMGETIHYESFAAFDCKTHADFYNIAFQYYLRSFDKTMEKLGL